MPDVGRDGLRKALRQGEISPLYFLYGSEVYQRELAVKTISDKALEGSELREFNEDSYTLVEHDLAFALAPAEQLPMLSTRRVIKISGLAKLKESEEDVLAAYLARPAETSTVIFIGDTVDKRKRSFKLLSEACVTAEFGKLSDNDLIDWARNSFREHGAVVDGPAIQELVHLAGNDLMRLVNEIEKLVTASLPEKVITRELVASLVPNSRELNNFDLADQIIAREGGQAIRTLKKILDDGGEPLMLLGLIAGNFHRLFVAKDLMKQGVDRTEVARAAGVPYFKQEEFLKTARKTEARRLAHFIGRCADVDLTIKTSQSTPRLLIEMLVAELAS